MTRLHQLHDRYGQSPWLDNLTRGDLTSGRLRRLVAQGIRGVTSNPPSSPRPSAARPTTTASSPP
jgi:hypothetical protein